MSKRAYIASINLIPPTCGPIQDVLNILRDKYGISEDDTSFAYLCITAQTGKFRRALVNCFAIIPKQKWGKVDLSVTER